MSNTRCYLVDDDSPFLKYSKAGCIFKCSINFAIENVGCLPWDFPVPLKWEEAKLEVCHSASPDTNQTNNKLVKFYEAMNNDSNLRTCQCMPDCEATIYDTQVRIYSYIDFIIYLSI